MPGGVPINCLPYQHGALLSCISPISIYKLSAMRSMHTNFVGPGLIITVSALVAAGIAVYESPQFREWMNNSRRKIALALHNLGDEIQPRDSQSPVREDISMVEESGEAAQERRRIAREEILQRGAMLEARRRRKQSSSLGSFDSLVDDDGNLRERGPSPLGTSDSFAKSTGVDLAASQRLQSGEVIERPEVTDNDRLHIGLPSDSYPQPRSETLVDITPTSEASGIDFGNPTGTLEETKSPVVDQPNVKSDPASSSSATEGEAPQMYHAHPGPSNENHRRLSSPFADMPISPTPSTAGSYSHIYESMDAPSDDTLSDLGRSVEGVATPASWSDVGSVTSEDAHQGL